MVAVRKRRRRRPKKTREAACAEGTNSNWARLASVVEFMSKLRYLFTDSLHCPAAGVKTTSESRSVAR